MEAEVSRVKSIGAELVLLINDFIETVDNETLKTNISEANEKFQKQILLMEKSNLTSKDLDSIWNKIIVLDNHFIKLQNESDDAQIIWSKTTELHKLFAYIRLGLPK